MDLLFCEHDIVVCMKPVGLDSEHDVPAALAEQLGGDIYPIHRLDKNVGGVMVFARTKQAASVLSQCVQNGDLIKEYVALTHGQPPAYGDWEDLLFKDSRKNKVFVVNKQRVGVKKARLIYQILSPGANTLVQIRLYTGRSHQIRVQFSSRGFPLVGDHKYGSRAVQTEPLLFSARITFPYHGQVLSFSALPDWANIPLRDW